MNDRKPCVCQPDCTATLRADSRWKYARGHAPKAALTGQRRTTVRPGLNAKPYDAAIAALDRELGVLDREIDRVDADLEKRYKARNDLQAKIDVIVYGISQAQFAKEIMVQRHAVVADVRDGLTLIQNREHMDANAYVAPKSEGGAR